MTLRIPTKARLLIPALLVLVWLVLFRPASLGGPAGYVMVSGLSMEPTIHDGDFVLTRAQDRYEVGDIVAFDVDGRIVIHRIIGGSGEAGFVMQGDNNPAPDDWRPTNNEILGERWIHVPGLGARLSQIRTSPAAFGGIVGLLVALAALGPARKRRPETEAHHTRTGVS
jgi:signal peptidase I